MTFLVDSTTYVAKNYDRASDGTPRTITPAGILLHTGEGTRKGDLAWLSGDTSGVSCGYYVTRDGMIYQLGPDTRRYWHGGGGHWDGVRDLNLFIGIETEHRKGQDWPAIQRAALAWLCRAKITAYAFPLHRIAAHRWAAQPPGRKSDPSDWDDEALRAWIAALYAPPSPGDALRDRRRTELRTLATRLRTAINPTPQIEAVLDRLEAIDRDVLPA